MDAGGKTRSRSAWRTLCLRGGLAQLLAGASLLSGADPTLTLPPQALEAKVAYGRIVSLERHGQVPTIVVRDRAAKVEREIMVGEGLAGLRRTEVIDFAVGGTGGIAVVLAAQFAMGATSALLAIYPREGNPTFLQLNDVLCSHIAIDPSSGVWCMGPSLADFMLYRITGPQSGPRQLLPRQSLRIAKGQGKESRESFENGPLGVPSLMSPTGGKLIAWFPNSRTVALANTRSGTVQAREVDMEFAGRAAISVAGDSDGRIVGLLPLRGKTDPEGFTTSYGLFQLSAADDSWQRIPNMDEVNRGTVIAGADGNAVVLWNRQQRTLKWISRPTSRTSGR